jgi:hypothetical protein
VSSAPERLILQSKTPRSRTAKKLSVCGSPEGGQGLTFCRLFLGIENRRNARNPLNLKDIVVLFENLLPP